MAATIKDIAKEAGVSIATVSRLINKSGYVARDTSVRVEKAIQKLGFRPSAVGRSLSTAKTKTIGVVVPSLSNPIFADSVAGLTKQVGDHGYHVMISASEYDRDQEAAAVDAFIARRVDAMVLTVADPDDSPALTSLDLAQIPYVLLCNLPGERNRPCITVDNRSAGKAVAEYLTELGHVRFAMISGKFRDSDRAIARRDGFIEGLHARGLEAPKICEMDFVDLDVDRVLDPLLRYPQTAPTALFCSNDLLAISVIGGLERRGIRVPKDISVVGFDGISVGAYLHPRLTTVIQPSREMGEAAAQVVLRRLNAEEMPEQAFLPFSLRPGESAGPAGKLCPTNPSGRSTTI